MTSQEYLKRLREQQASIVQRENDDEDADRERLARLLERRAAIRRGKQKNRAVITLSLTALCAGVLLGPVAVYVTDSAVGLLTERARRGARVSSRDGAPMWSFREKSPSVSPRAQPQMAAAVTSPDRLAEADATADGGEPRTPHGTGGQPDGAERPDDIRRPAAQASAEGPDEPRRPAAQASAERPDVPRRPAAQASAERPPAQGGAERADDIRRPAAQDGAERSEETTRPSLRQAAAPARAGATDRAPALAKPQAARAESPGGPSEPPAIPSDSSRIAAVTPRVPPEQVTPRSADQASPSADPMPSTTATDSRNPALPKSSDPRPKASELVQPSLGSTEAPRLSGGDAAVTPPGIPPVPVIVVVSPQTPPTAVERAKKVLGYIPEVRLAMIVARWVKSRTSEETGSSGEP
jgi:hypothetical protein